MNNAAARTGTQPVTDPSSRTIVDLCSPSMTLRMALRSALSARGAALRLMSPSVACSLPEGAGRVAATVVDVDRIETDVARVTGKLVVLLPDAIWERRSAWAGANRHILRRPEETDEAGLRALANEIAKVVAPTNLASKSGPIGSLRERAPVHRPEVELTAPAPASSVTRRVVPITRPVKKEIIVVASSTGGPYALINVLGALPKLGLPVLIVQHMPATFTPILADHITKATAWPAREATDDESLTADEVRIAPGGYHLMLAQSGSGVRLRLNQDPPVNFCRPAADVLFYSAAEIFGAATLALILTGMGTDGTSGAAAIAAAGGTVFAQDKETSVVWGMPGAAMSAGVVDKVVPLPEIAGVIAATVKGLRV